MVVRGIKNSDVQSLRPDSQAPARHSLARMEVTRISRHVVAYTPSMAEVERLFDTMRPELGSQTSLDTVRRIMSANPNTFQAFARRESYDWANPRAEGFIAWLPLSDAGRIALLSGSFSGPNPSPDHIAAQHEKPAAIYVWGIYAPGRLAGGVALAFDRMSTPLNRDADLYAWGPTAAGQRLIASLGFVPIGAGGRSGILSLSIFRRSAPTAETAGISAPLYDTYPSSTHTFSVTVVRSANDLAKVMAIRSATFLGEQACPYDEEFDGNDFSSTHLLGFVNNEPAASIRVRCFANFAKAERLVVRPEFRKSRLAFVIVKAAHELCRVKGYRQIYGHAQKDLVEFWSRAGGRSFPGAREFKFSDNIYFEMMSEVLPHPDAIEIGADPYLIIRPEGRWHVPGVLEHSVSRPVATHSADPLLRKQRRA